MDIFLILTHLSVYSVMLAYYVYGESCVFPMAWQGQWYQSGRGDITISHHHITGKGLCRDHVREYYLLENLEEHCHQCLLILQRHSNILQYKQSYCIGKDNLQSMCGQIRVDSILYTLVRVPSFPVPCPIKNAFFMTYNNNSGGFCRSPMSYVHQCASSTLFHYEFKRCQYSAYTYEKEMDFRCLATWKDGSDLYLYGAFTGTDLMNKDDIYRCFIYTVLGTVVYMSVSADSTCLGLRSPKDGPLVMELTQDVFGWPEAKCRYPRWLVDRNWRDLSGRYHYTIETDGTVMTTTYTTVGNTTTFQTSFHCLSSMNLNDTYQEGFIALVHVLDHCTSHFRCIKVRETYSEMVEIHLGDYVADKKVTCTEDHFRSATVRMLILVDLRPIECPHHGRYTSMMDEDNCQQELRSSCDKAYSLNIVSSCHMKPVLELECLAWWQTRDKVVLLAEDTITGLINCLAVAEADGQLTLGTDSSCNLGVSSLLLHHITFSFRAYREPCTTIATSPPIRGVKHIDGSQDDDPGGGYSLLEAGEPTTKSNLPRQTSNFKQFTSTGIIHCYDLLLLSCISFMSILINAR